MALTGKEALYISNGGSGQVAITLDEIVAYVNAQGGVAWSDIADKPTTFTPTTGTEADEALAGDTPILPAAAITAIGTLTAESTAADIVTALQST